MGFGEASWWTAERDAVLAHKWAAGLSTARIAADMGTTKNAVVGRAHRLGLPPRRSPILRVAETPEQAAARRAAAQARREADAASARRVAFAAAAGDGVRRSTGSDAIRGDTLAALGVIPPAAQREGAEAVALPPTSRTHRCQWPMWGDGRPGVSPAFCDDPAVVSRPYCPAHCRAAYVGVVRERSAAELATDEARRRWALARALERVEAQRRNRLWVGL